MILTYTIPGNSPERFESDAINVIIGRRPRSGQHVDIELEPDEYVSRLHACIFAEGEEVWIKDLGSSNGTWINGIEVREKTRMMPGDEVRIGYTLFSLEPPPEALEAEEASDPFGSEKTVFTQQEVETEPPPAEPEDTPRPRRSFTVVNPEAQDRAEASGEPINLAATYQRQVTTEERLESPESAPEAAPPEPVMEKEDRTQINPSISPDLEPIGVACDAEDDFREGELVHETEVTEHPLIGFGRDKVDEVLMQGWRHLKAFNALTHRLCRAENLDSLVGVLIEHLQEAIPNALRGAVLLPDHGGDLLLKAHWPRGDHSVSMTWVRRAYQKREAFIWTAPEEGASECDTPSSAVYYDVQAAIYVPLERGEEVLGVIYVDNYYARDAFSPTDLELLKAIANQVALFLRDRFMIQERQEDQQMLDSLARQFPPHMLEQIREKARWKRLGGERINPATMLMADVRGFTSLTREMDPDDIVHMLNEMFDALVPIIFEYDGMVDKFIGDCVLAVFGSPQADKQQWEKALRAGMQMQKAIRMLGEGRRARRLPVFDVGIGIHSGEIIHGFIGSAERMEYTVVGETVNRVSRYCDGAEAGELLISQTVYEHVYRMVRVQSKRIRGKHAETEPDLEGYVVLGLK